MKNGSGILLFFIIVFIGCTANNSLLIKNESYSIDEISGWQSFLALSELEKLEIRAEEKSNRIADHLFAVDSLFIRGTPDSLKAKYYKEEVQRRKSFQFNRSRWSITTFVNNEIQDSAFVDENNTTLDCNCALVGNQIRILMGTWVFGGTFLHITLNKGNYRAEFIEDAHKSKPYKYSLQDSLLVSTLALRIDKKNLILRKKPEFQLDYLIEGLIEFETPLYYSDFRYNLGRVEGKRERMDEMRTEGRILFTCELKKEQTNENE